MNRAKQLIIAGVGIGGSIAGALGFSHLHGESPAKSPHAFASYTSSTAFPDNATPESALKSLGWAASKGDIELLRDAVTPEVQKMLHERHGQDMRSHVLGVATQLGGAHLLRKEIVSEEQVLLYVQPETQDHPWTVRMQKSGSGWKLAGLTI